MDYEKVLKLIYPEPGQSIFTDTQLKQIYELIKYYDYYENNVFKYIEAEYPEYRKTNERSPAQIPINYSQYIVDKLAEWQFEEPIDISVTTENKADDKKADEVEKDLYKLHKKNKMDLKLLQAAKECNISGGVAIKMIYDPELKMVRFLPRPRIECFPVTEFDDYEKINKVHFVAFKSEDIVWKQTFEMKDGKCLFSEATYNVKNNLELEEWIQKPTFLGSGNKYIDFMPVYIIPNTPGVGMIWGYSELANLIPIINELNKKYSDASDALRFEMFAITIIMNMKDFSTTGRPKTKPGAVWRLMSAGTGDAKTDIKKLESSFAYRETLNNHTESLKNAMFELSSVIQINPETVSRLGSMSGVALKLMYASMISKTNIKNVVWKPILEQMYYESLKMRGVYEAYSFPEVNIEIINHLPIPLNEKEEVEIATMKLAAGLSSTRAAMDSLGIQDPEAMMAEILEEENSREESYK